MGVTIPNTHRISKLVKMISDNGANLTVTEWVDDHSEMLGEWEVQSRYDMDFLVEKSDQISVFRQFLKCVIVCDPVSLFIFSSTPISTKPLNILRKCR